MAIQDFFPYLPQYTDWETFNGNLIMFYAEELIPFSSEADWMVTAKNIAQTPAFSVYPVPDPERFASWQDWANEFTLIINGPSQQ